MRRALLALLFIAAAPVLTACGGYLDPPAAVVAGRAIDADLITRLVDGYERSSAFEQAQGDSQAVLRRYEQEVLSQLIRAEIIGAAARRAGVAVSETDVDEALERVERDFGSRADFRREVANRGFTLERVRDLIAADVIETKLREQVTAGLLIEDEDLRRYYLENISTYSRTRLAHIQVAGLPLARRLSQQLRSAPAGRVREEFARLAREHSQDAGSAGRGGDLGFLQLDAFPPDIRSAVEELSENEVSEPVRSQAGWHVLQLLEHRITPFHEVRDAILQQRRQQDSEALWQRYVRDLYERADVEVNPRYGRLDPQTQTVVNFDPNSAPGAGDVESTPRPADR